MFSTTTYINKGEKKEINIGKTNEKGKFIKDKINVKFEYMASSTSKLRLMYKNNQNQTITYPPSQETPIEIKLK
jgi:hypothetical protein